MIIALKGSFAAEVQRTRGALAEMRAADVLPASIGCSVFEGPDEYLYGEETALLETIDGRGPFPRVVPPYRVGLLGEDPHSRVGAGPALVNNLETIANVPEIMARGARRFRAVGTADSPGTVVCTVTGDVRRHGVGDVPMGTPLRQVLDTIGGRPIAPIKAVRHHAARRSRPDAGRARSRRSYRRLQFASDLRRRGTRSHRLAGHGQHPVELSAHVTARPDQQANDSPATWLTGEARDATRSTARGALDDDPGVSERAHISTWGITPTCR